MFVTIWMWTHEWSLISIRATALTLETCHQPLSCLSAFTRSTIVRSLRLPRTGTLIRIRSTASDGVSRASRSASSEAGWSIRSAVSLSIATTGVYSGVPWKDLRRECSCAPAARHRRDPRRRDQDLLAPRAHALQDRRLRRPARADPRERRSGVGAAAG